jgi:hypothetical protein
MNRQSTKDFQASETVLYDTITMGTCHYSFVQTHRIYATNSEPYYMNYGVWVITMYQCRFISYNKCATLAEDADSEGGCAHGKEGDMYEISIPSSQYCCKPRIAITYSIIRLIIRL